MPTRCLILCGGENSRWKNYRNLRHKHLINIEGEILINRTLRLVSEHIPVNDIFVVLNNTDLNIYKSNLLLSANLYGIDLRSSQQTAACKFLSSKELWNKNGRTIVLLGDVWFSEEAILKIFDETTEDWTAFGRSGPNELTGHPYGELFAQSFISYQEHEYNLRVLNEMYLTERCIRAGSGWAHYQLMIGASPNLHTVGSRFVEIYDFTDDFDCPEDFDAWHLGRSYYSEVIENYNQLGFQWH